MANLQLDKCCCCINLRTGCLILGYLGVIGSIITIVFFAVGMTSGYPKGDVTVLISPAHGWAVIIFTIIVIGFYVMLLMGVYKRKPAYVNIVWIVMIVYNVLQTIVMLTDPANQSAGNIIGAILGFCLTVYFALCIRSYYLVLKDEGFRPANQGGHA